MTKSRRIRRKGLAIVLSLGMVASLFVGKGKISRAEDEYEIGEITSGNVKMGIKGKVVDNKIEEAYIFYVTDTNSATPLNTIPSGTEISLKTSDIDGFSKDIASIGEVAGEVDSFIRGINVQTGVTIDASETTLTTVNNYVGYGRTGMTLKLPKTLETVGSNVLKSAESADNIIYVDALNASFANKSTYTGVAFHGYKNSTLKDHFGPSGFYSDESDKPDAIHNYAAGSVLFTLDIGTSDGHVSPDRNGSPTSLYAYANTRDDTDTKYKGFMNLSKVPKKTYHTFKGYYDGDDQIFDENGIYKGWNQPTASGGTDTVDALNEKTLTAKWKPNDREIEVSFVPNAPDRATVTGTMPKIYATYGVVYTDPTDPTKGLPECDYSCTGYTFKGWAKSSLGNPDSVYNENDGKNAIFYGDNDKTLYAKWEKNKYKFEYNPDYPAGLAAGNTGNKSKKTVEYDISDKLTTINTDSQGFTAKGYRFVGWSYKTAAETTGASSPVERPVAGATVGEVLEYKNYTQDTIPLYGMWEVEEYGIHYYFPASGDEEVRYNYWDEVTLPMGDEKIGYTFKGWSKTRDGSPEYEGGKKYINIFEPDLYNQIYNPLYACYEKNGYTVKYLKNTKGGTDEGATEDSEFFYDSFNTMNSCGYTRKGCKFVGWSTGEYEPLVENAPEDNIKSKTPYNTLTKSFPLVEYFNELYQKRNTSTNTVTLYPLWQKIKYKINYDDNATDAKVSAGTKTAEYSYGRTVDLPTLTRPGHYFKGWYDEQNNKVDKITPEVIDRLSSDAVTKNYTVNLHANWDDDYVIKLGNSNIKTVTAKVDGIQKTLVSNGTVQNITFKGQREGHSGEVLSNITITAIDNYLITGYRITDASGSEVNKVDYSTFKSSVVVGKDIEFPASDMTITITVKPQEYKLTFNTDGGTIIGSTPTSYTYGTELILPTYVVKDNAKFYGWKNSYGTIITMISKTQTGDVTLTAVWSDPNVTGLPQGATASASANGKYVIIKYANGSTEDVNIAAQGIALKNGSNSIQFKTSDNKTYLVTLNYTTATELPSTVKAVLPIGSTTATITYADSTTQSVVVNMYNSETTLAGTRIYFDGIDGKRYTVVPTDDSNVPIKPTVSPSPTSTPGSNQKPKSDEYFMISSVSYNVKSGKVSAVSPINWDDKTVTVKDKVKIYGKSYKVTKVTKDAFYGMPKLKKLIIGKYVTYIGANAARDCSKLKVVKIMSGNVKTVGKNCLKNIGKNATVYIKASKKKYKKLRNLLRKKSGCPKSTKFRRIKT